MAPRTIAERAAAGEALHAPDLDVPEQDELIVWARQQEMKYEEIKRRYGFTQEAVTLRGRYLKVTGNKPPRVPTFTPVDDNLLRNAVQLYATGPLSEKKSLDGIWKQVKLYIQKNGGQTTAGLWSLKTRWYSITGRTLPPSARTASGTRARARATAATQAAPQAAPATQAQPQVGLARSFPVFTLPTDSASPAQPPSPQAAATPGNSSAGESSGKQWEEEYESLSEGEMREVLGEDDYDEYYGEEHDEEYDEYNDDFYEEN